MNAARFVGACKSNAPDAWSSLFSARDVAHGVADIIAYSKSDLQGEAEADDRPYRSKPEPFTNKGPKTFQEHEDTYRRDGARFVKMHLKVDDSNYLLAHNLKEAMLSSGIWKEEDFVHVDKSGEKLAQSVMIK